MFAGPNVTEVADVLPSSNIDFANRTFLTIKCRYDIENLLMFFLVRNHSEIIVRIDFQLKTRSFAVVTRRKGFDCTVPTFPADKKGVITCSKRYPSCEDATYYKCSANKESSKSRLVRGTEQKAIRDNAVIEIADVLPSSNIDFENRTFLTIKCRYAIENLIQFFLVRNHSEVIVQIYYQKKTRSFAVVSRRKGFDCTVPKVPGDKKGVITCSKHYPSCEDATYYKCSTYKESSKSRLVRGTEQKAIRDNAGTEQKAIRDNADKLSDANIITKILKFAATLLVIGHFH
ncbi:Hypothetical predicted protein [Octopus vulgaris]|uniref:Uncharacterized protein n=1 Tax=Octopus vulgaris TaxID=6645 RepID=A0AA36BNV0_OCTVU|nr:Hypothetical predicted protein [Octopus vulgaris]